MLNIPEEVKQLFRQGSVKKNIRVHFPNGEREDITNSNLISESFLFVESICSQDTLKFGLCEANMVEFDCFGIGNIEEHEIEVFHEIDISSLGEQFISEHGIKGNNIDFAFYRIPYGRFKVDSCKRQPDMKKRHVVAYSRIISDNMELSQLEKEKRACFVTKNVNYDFDVISFMYSNIKNLDREMLETVSVHGDSAKPFAEGYYSEYESGRSAKVTCYAHSSSFYFKNETGFNFVCGEMLEPNGLYRTTIAKHNKYDISSARIKELLNNGYWGTEYGAEYEDISKELIEQMLHPFIQFTKLKRMDTHNLSINEFIPYESDEYIYPYISGMDDDSNHYRMTLRIPRYISLQWDDTGTYEFLDLYEGKTIYKDKPKDNVLSINLSFPREEKYGGWYLKKDIPSRNIITSYAEINGMFGRSNRNGIFVFSPLKNTRSLFPSETLYPSESLYPSECDSIASTYDYRNLWYEEYEVQPFGKIVVFYKDKDGKEQRFVYVFDESASNVYTLNDNYILLNSKMDEENIKIMLDTYFIPNIKGLNYTPFEITMKGIPYIEAGDTINILTFDSGFESFVFSRTIQGIQSLSDDVETRGKKENINNISNTEFYKEI